MKSPVTRPKLLLAILAFPVAIFACTALLRAQNLPPQNGPDTPAAGDPAKHQLPFECSSRLATSIAAEFFPTEILNKPIWEISGVPLTP